MGSESRVVAIVTIYPRHTLQTGFSENTPLSILLYPVPLFQ